MFFSSLVSINDLTSFDGFQIGSTQRPLTFFPFFFSHGQFSHLVSVCFGLVGGFKIYKGPFRGVLAADFPPTFLTS